MRPQIGRDQNESAQFCAFTPRRRRIVSARQLLLLLTLAGVVSSAAAQGIHVTLRSNQDPYSAYQSYAGVWGDGNYAYIGSERRNGVLIYDITNPDAPVLASYYSPSNSLDMEDIKVANGLGFFADNMGSGLHIVDVSDPSHPALLSQITSANGGFDNTHKVAIWQNFVFIPQNLTSPAIIKVFDVSNPAAPALKTTFTATDPKWVNDIDIQTNTAGKTLLYTSGWGGKCDIWDITNIATGSPVLLGSFSAGVDGSSASATADGNYLAYTTKNTNGTSFVTIYKISNPASVTVASTLMMTTLGIDAVSPHDPKIMGNLLYVSWYQAGTLIFDITDPNAPVFVGSYDTWPGLVNPGQLDGNWGVYPYLGQDRVLLSDRNTGLYIVNATGVNSQAALYNLHLNPSTVLAGSSSTGTAYLVGVAGSAGVVVTTSSDNAAAVPPPNVTVASGSTSANFNITTSAVSSTTAATITAAYGGTSDTAVLTVTPVADFLVAAAPASQTIYPNQNGTVNGTITAAAGYSSAVTLSCTGSPPPTCTPSPSTLTPTPAGVPFTLTVAGLNSATYNFNLHVVGSDSKTTTHDVPLTVDVADFTLGAPSPSNLTVLPGMSSPFTLQVGATGAFTSTVDLYCNAPATGVACSFLPSAAVNPTVASPVNVTTTVATAAATPVGQYTLTVSGNSVGAPSPKTQSVILDVVDFALGSPSPGSVSVTPGGNAPVTAQVSALGNFTGAVALSCNTPAAGISCGFFPSASVSPTAGNPVSVMVTVATTSATAAGMYSVVVSANSTGALAPKTQTIALAVTDFSISARQTSASVPAGQTASYALTVSGVNGSFPNAVTLACSGAPALTACSITPGSVTPGASGSSATVTVTTTARAAALPLSPGPWYATWLPLVGIAFVAPATGGKRARRLRFLVCLFVGLALLPGCGGNSSSSPPPLPGTVQGAYTIMVSGTSGPLSHAIPLTLIVQ